MANGKKIKELELATAISDTDDFVVEDVTPKTRRVKWSQMVSGVKTAIETDLTITDEDIRNIYNDLYPAK